MNPSPPPSNVPLGDRIEPSGEFALLGDLLAADPPPMRAGILATARQRPRLRPTPFNPIEALAAVVDDAEALLADLTAAEWAAPRALGDYSVHDTVSHLIGADRYLGVKVGAWPGETPADEHDHLAVTDPAVIEGRSLTDAELLERWRSTSRALVDHLRTIDVATLGEPSRYCVIEGPLGLVLIARAFELWTHVEDICRATGRPLRSPAEAVLGAMTDVAADLVPVGYTMEMSGAATDATLRLVLTGPGGGTWDRSLEPGGEAGEPDLVLVADAVDFCRMVARRVEPSDLDCELLGRRELGAAVLAGSTRFAMD